MNLLALPTEPIQTDRLLLRRFCVADLRDALHNWEACSELFGVQMQLHPLSQVAVRELFAKWQQEFRFTVILKETGEPIGQIGFSRYYAADKSAELEYHIGAAFEGNDYPAEALRRLIHYLFMETEIALIEILCSKTDSRSWRVVQKAGMYQVKTLRRFAFETPPADAVCYAVSRQRYFDIY